MNGYLPHNVVTVLLVALILVGTLLSGLALSRQVPHWHTRLLAWLITLGVTAGVERLTREEPAGLRMLALIATLLYGMKGVISLEARAEGSPPLPPARWLGFAALWPGMRPSPFAQRNPGPQPGGWELLGWGLRLGFLGLSLGGLAALTWHSGRPPLSDGGARWLATLLLLPGISLTLHFGIFNVLAGLWRLAGVDARSLFRAPLAATSLENFWSRRWNLAFSEMTMLGIYRPLSDSLGRGAATGIAFIASGLLHELAISVPVLTGFGLPLLYFLLHGGLVLAERVLARAGHPVTGWGWWSHAWVLGWLAVPLPILFHPPFLRGCVWPLIGLE